MSWSELLPSGPVPPVSAAELEAAVYHVGRAVWREARILGVRSEAMQDLQDALEAYTAIRDGQVHSPEALSRAAGQILQWTAELIRQAPAAADAAA